MRTVTTRNDETDSTLVLYVALELGTKKWKVGFTTGMGQRPRLITIAAGALEVLRREIGKAKERFKLPQDARVRSCYEAGREGFWVHRALSAEKIENLVLDSASIPVDRRARRAKSDGLDVVALLDLLTRYHAGQRHCCRVVVAPSREEEDARQVQRELRELKEERTALTNRIKGLLATQGVRLGERGLRKMKAGELRDWEGRELAEGLARRIRHEMERLGQLNAQIDELEQERKAQLKASDAEKPGDAGDAKEVLRAAVVAKKLMKLRAIGPETAWTCSVEVFSWRTFRNTGQVGALLGLAPTPYQSGSSNHEQGISKAGNRHVRAIAIEAAWSWLVNQPGSALSIWFQKRFAAGGPRMRKKGIVALARKLMIALWKYVQFDEMPAGALLKG